jgi:hypothetical protein
MKTLANLTTTTTTTTTNNNNNNNNNSSHSEMRPESLRAPFSQTFLIQFRLPLVHVKSRNVDNNVITSFHFHGSLTADYSLHFPLNELQVTLEPVPLQAKGNHVTAQRHFPISIPPKVRGIRGRGYVTSWIGRERRHTWTSISTHLTALDLFL